MLRVFAQTARYTAFTRSLSTTRSIFAAKGGRVFETTQETFEKDVLESDTPTLVDFYANWCQPCKMLSPVLTKAVETDGRVNLAKINVDENLDLAHDYKVTSLPTVVAFRDGEPTAAFIGMRPPAAIQQFIDETAEGKN
ncbi:thioredoxin [Linderina pennispora]|uniref:Thioredoxin n=1 Tax=Linderina pennispora TaxID=61395 RepID=A0A1Y1WGN4_9FUNG|nr:thioredoxin [Linderina pennispora]ORX72632.1 thioredoxin [Linderina pennispora]